MLDTVELLELEDSLKKELESRLSEIITQLNRKEQLLDFLDMIGLSNLLSQTKQFKPYKTGKIVIVGESEIKPNIIEAILTNLGIDKRRVELYLGYEKAVSFDVSKIQWDADYSLIAFGPVPHSGVSKAEYSSIITRVEREDGFPPVMRLGENELKITKSNFRKMIETAIENNILSPNS